MVLRAGLHVYAQCIWRRKIQISALEEFRFSIFLHLIVQILCLSWYMHFHGATHTYTYTHCHLKIEITYTVSWMLFTTQTSTMITRKRPVNTSYDYQVVYYVTSLVCCNLPYNLAEGSNSVSKLDKIMNTYIGSMFVCIAVYSHRARNPLRCSVVSSATQVTSWQ